jgi:hypothetical protein
MTALLLATFLAISFAIPTFATGYGQGTVPELAPYVPPTVSETPTVPITPVTPAVPTADNPRPATVAGVQKALEDAIAVTDDDPETPVVVALENVSRIRKSAIRDVFKEAAAAGIEDLVFTLDTKEEDGKVLSKITITEEIASKLKSSVNFSVKLSGSEVKRAVSNVNRYFSNKNVAAVSLAQRGAFGADIPMAVAVDLSKMNKESLLFYVFSGLTFRYAQLETEYEVDDGGFLHFSTPVGGNIIITDKPLERRSR